MRSFASDNNASVHPSILLAIQEANTGHARGYGDDPWTASATAQFKETFAADCETLLVFNGTGANVIALSLLLDRYHSVLCHAGAHISCDECGAPELMTSAKLTLVHNSDGKVHPADVEKFVVTRGVVHHVQPRAVSISQTNELGRCYTKDELVALAECCKQHGLLLHMDGARLSNAAAALNCSLADLTHGCGIDVLSFGGTKNGLLLGEAIVIFNPSLFGRAQFIRKQTAQLASKMRYIAAQFIPYLRDELWRVNAVQANRMAKRLEQEIASLPQIRLTQPVEANALFAVLPAHAITALQSRYFFYVWNAALNEVRWMTSFDTSAEDVTEFARAIKDATA
ncbi:MAG: low specificity L-threonine aldolase [Bdellovibrionota bacterium]|nr:MAG: low specificity L-threonine aldolase [Bdellovibrionota bacterium]